MKQPSRSFIPIRAAVLREPSAPLRIERLVRFYDFTEINRAIADSRRGQAIKPVLLISQQ
jgi:aryl-alcohol dehydrogenase